MSTVNKVILIGNLGKTPEVRTFGDGGKVCNFSIATSEHWTDKQSGEKRERTEWHAVTIFVDGLIGVAEQYLHKGSKVYVEGQLQTRKWTDQQGQDRYTTEIIADEMQMLGGRSGGSAPMGAGPSADSPVSEPPKQGPDDFDDDIPF